MVQTVSLAPTVNDGPSSNIVVAEGAEVVIGLYVATGQLSDAGQFEATVTQVTPWSPNNITKLSAAGRLTLVAAGASSAVLNQSAAGVQIVEVPFTMDATGTLVFTAAPQAPSTFANVSGVDLVFA